MVASMHGALAAPSSWVLRFVPLLDEGAPALDLACGSGRHARLLASRGHPVLAVDRDAAALAALADCPGVRCLLADLEAGPWPLGADQRFGAVVVTNYLWRPRFDQLLAAVDDGGMLIYETFGRAQAAIGKPSNPAFLLEPGELLQRCAGLRVIAYEDGYVERPQPAFVQRICAVRPQAATAPAPRRYRLESPG
jgi:SAM-dependent methyltransferase